ncbi:hypothetical protein ACQEXU_09050 [Vibrio sp. TRT 21S02]|uniref:hypothetical protein n=1 Tax=unclassified Vibrio TaxID=2614977 RepID=UPI00349F2ABD
MIAVHRNYLLQNAKHWHAHVAVNPVGIIDIEIKENHVHHSSSFDDLQFESIANKTRLRGQGNSTQWEVMLSDHDALELSHLIHEANEELETLLRDL